MIKKIKIEDLQIGMFVHDFQGGWQDATIFIDQMTVNDLKVIEILRSWGIREVLIDTSRGRDIADSAAADKVRPAAEKKASPPSSRKKPGPSPVPFETEVKQAEKIKHEAIAVVNDITKRAREGKPPDVSLAFDVATKMMSSVRRNRDALVLLTRMRHKDEYTLYHSMSVSSLILTFCDFLEISETRALDMAVGALLHDIGKAMIPDAILNKPAKLTPAEFEVMKMHAEYSVDLLRKAKSLPLDCFDIALHHHERYDGSGYPHGLDQGRIGVGALMTAICDVFDAVTSNRCYKEGMGVVSGLKLIYTSSGSHFHKQLAYEFIECMGVYPVGSCVRLSDGKIGIVSGRSGDMEKPIVKIVHDNQRKEKFTPFTLDLSPTDITITGYEPFMTMGLNPSKALSIICR